MASIMIYAGAAIAEILGCFAIWYWLRMGKSAIWAIPGILALILFAVLLTRVDSAFAGRAYAGYGGIYVAISLIWLRLVEGVTPDRWDIIGAGLCILGTVVIILGPRT